MAHSCLGGGKVDVCAALANSRSCGGRYPVRCDPTRHIRYSSVFLLDIAHVLTCTCNKYRLCTRALSHGSAITNQVIGPQAHASWAHSALAGSLGLGCVPTTRIKNMNKLVARTGRSQYVVIILYRMGFRRPIVCKLGSSLLRPRGSHAVLSTLRFTPAQCGIRNCGNRALG